jgi:hypothetical protein
MESMMDLLICSTEKGDLECCGFGDGWRLMYRLQMFCSYGFSFPLYYVTFPEANVNTICSTEPNSLLFYFQTRTV